MTTLTLIGEPFPDWEADLQRAAVEDLTQALADTASRACGTRLLVARGRDEPEFNSPNIQVAQLPMTGSMLPVMWQTSPTARPLDGEFVHALTPMIPLRGRSADDGSQSSVTVPHTLAWEAPQLLGSGSARLYRSFTRRAIKHADVVITPSYAVASVLQRRYGAELPIQVLPLATPSPLLEPGDAPERRERHSLPPRYLVTTATPTEPGRLNWVLEAMKKDPSIPTLVIIEGVDPTSPTDGAKKARGTQRASEVQQPSAALSAEMSEDRNPVGPRKVRRSKPLPDENGSSEQDAAPAAPQKPVRYAKPQTPAPAEPKPATQYAPPPFVAPEETGESLAGTRPEPAPAAPIAASAASVPVAPPPAVPADEAPAKASKPAKQAKQAKAAKPARAAAKPAADTVKPAKPAKPAKTTKAQHPAEDLSGVRFVQASIPEELRDRVIVVKPHDVEDIGAIISGAELMLQPQQVTGSGYLLHAALSAHVPILHSECAVTHELDAGVSAANAEEFSDVLSRLAVDPEYRSALSVLASDRSRSFGWRATAWQLWELHANL